MKNYCSNCGTQLGLDCGEAERDFSKDYCSEGCNNISKLKNIISNAWREDWMDDDDWKEFEELSGLDYEDLNKKLEIGKENGYSVDTQLEIAKALLIKTK